MKVILMSHQEQSRIVSTISRPSLHLVRQYIMQLLVEQ